MTKRNFQISKHISDIEILKKLEYLGKHNLTVTGHGHEQFGSIPIIESANKSTRSYTSKFKEKPAIALLEVVLAANRNFNKVVEPHIKRIETEYPTLRNFKQLREIIDLKTKDEFYFFWGHKDEKKYNTLKRLLLNIETLKKQNPKIKDDFSLMNNWGMNADISNYNMDIIGSIPNIAIATFQHLRMVFGVDTIKPDQRVKEVLDFEFGLPKLSDLNVIKAVEQIAQISKIKVITIDQIFVQYGSSYYNQSANKITLKQIVINLKRLGVENKVISKATSLSIRQVERML